MKQCNTATTSAIRQAAALLHGGGLVAFPTETVYGLGANALDQNAVAKIFKAKGRPGNNPLIVHVADLEAARRLGHFNEIAVALAQAFWPGPLSLVVPLRDDAMICDKVTANLTTIAIRVPAQRAATALLAACRLPIAAPSANRSGHISPTSAAHVAQDLGVKVAMILDDGPCQIGLESTIVDATGNTPRHLRPGNITQQDIETAINSARSAHVFRDIADQQPANLPQTGTLTAPGQLASHYAPRALLRLMATHVEPCEALLAFGQNLPAHTGPMINLSVIGDVREAAAKLFGALRELDKLPITSIAVMPVPRRGIGIALNDRLTRAAAARPPQINLKSTKWTT